MLSHPRRICSCLRWARFTPPTCSRNWAYCDAGKLLHAERAFDYVRPAFAGDRLRLDEHIADVVEKKDGALLFKILETEVTDAEDKRVATIRHSEVVKTTS
jgi:acyl dehydratase